MMFAMICLGIVSNIDSLSGQVSVDKKHVHYTLDLADAKNHYIRVTVDVPTEGKTTDLMMAVWTPGSYLVREYARHVDSIGMSDPEGKPLEFEKVKKNRWQVQTEGVDHFTVSYRLYCNQLSVRTNWVGRQFAVLNGAATFLTVPERIPQPHIVRLKLPKGWNRSATSLAAHDDQPHTFVAGSFDELVDSPIVAGNIHVYPFQAGGVEHQLVNVGESGYWDGSKASADLKKVVEEHQRMWGVVPYDRYLFLNVIGERGGGLEHDNSTLIMTSRWNFRDSKRYKDWLSLASHEFFHAWNVRRLRPKSLIEYDYENEVYTESLWVAEGITSYYEDLALVRAGLISAKEFVERMSKNIESVQTANGRTVQSLSNSSYDTWIKFYRPDENAGNTRISYYSKGAVVAFLLDAKIRRLTDGSKSLDDVMKDMYAEYLETGFTPEDFRNMASEVAGEDLTAWFQSAVDSTDELEFADARWLGLEIPSAGIQGEATDDGESAQSEAEASLSLNSLNAGESNGNGEDSDADPADKSTAEDLVEKKEPKKLTPWLGIRTASSNGRLTISNVRSNSPGTDAGLNPGDEIIAIDGFRTTSSIDSRLQQFEIGDEIIVLISRRGKLMELPIVIGAKPEQDWKMRLIRKPDAEQKKQRDLWLGR